MQTVLQDEKGRKKKGYEYHFKETPTASTSKGLENHGHLFNGRLLAGRWPCHHFTDTLNNVLGDVFPAPPLGF